MTNTNDTRGRLEGRVALISGETDLNHGIAARLRAEGARVELRDFPADEAGARALVKSVTDAHGRLDILVNGIDEALDVNPLSGMDDVAVPAARKLFWMMRAAFDAMRAAGGGRIINLVDPHGDSLFRGRAGAEIESAAVKALTRAAAEEWGVDGVLVNALAAAADTAAFQAMRAQRAEAVDALVAGSSMRRMGDPERDIGGAVLLLAGEAGGFLTGHVVRADGGQHLTPTPWEAAMPAADAGS